MTDWLEFQQDNAWDQYMEQQYLEEIAEEGVERFSRDRLQAYYRENPTVAQNALNALRVAESLVAPSPSASLVFAAVSVELTIKNVILRPLVFGLVHNEAVAGFVAQCAVGRGGANRFERLLNPLLNELASVDLKAYCRVGQSTPLAGEVSQVVERRNAVLHEGRAATREEADMALHVSRSLLFDVFPVLIRAMDMTIDEELRVA